MITYGIDSFGRVYKQTMPIIDYSEDNTNLCATLEYIEDDGIKRLLLENKNYSLQLSQLQQENDRLKRLSKSDCEASQDILCEESTKWQQEKEEFEKIISKILNQIRDYKNIFNRLENIHYSHVERELDAIEYKIYTGLDNISKLKESDKDVS